MAQFSNSIRLGISLPKASDVQGSLNSLVKQLNDTKINLDINIANSNVAKQLETLTNLADNFKNSLGGNISLGNVNEVINQVTSAMEGLNGEILKTNVKTFNDITTVTRTLATDIGEVTKQTEKFINEGGQLQKIGQTITTVTENVDKFKQSMEDIQKAISSLDSMKLNGLVDANSIDKLKSNLNTVYTESNKENGASFTDSELTNYLNQVRQLENEEKNLKTIQDADNKELEAMYKLQQDDLKQLQQLEQQREKELQQENELVAKQEEAYRQLDILKQNGIINNDDISKLEKMVQESNSLKEVNNALKSIMNTSMFNESSIVSLSKQLDDAQIKLNKMKQTFGENLSNNFIESTQSSINQLREDLQNVDGMNFNGIKNGLNQVNTDMKVTTNETQQLVNSLKETNGSFFTGISSFLATAGIFYGVAQAVQEVKTQLTNCFEQVKKMDEAFTDINITMNISKQQFADMSDKITQMGVQYGKSGNDIMQIAKTYSNAQSSVEEVMSKVKPDLWLANVSRIDSADITKTLQSVNNQFELMTKDGMSAEQATTKIGNSLVAVSKNMQFDFVDGIKKMTEAVKTGGSIANNAKMSMDDFLSMTGAFIQQSGMSGSEFANALKFISARVLQQKELGAELGITEQEMKKAEATLNSFDISIRTQGGGLRSLTDILKDTSVAFGKMSDSDRQYVASALAGTNQSARFIDIMNSMKNQQMLYNATQTDTTALYDAQQKYAESLEGRLGSLKATYEGLMNKMVNSETAKWLVTEATQFLTMLGQIDGKTIAFTATIGGLVLTMSKLSDLNKTLIAGEAVTGLSKFIAIASGMSTFQTTIKGVATSVEEVTNATEAMMLLQGEETVATVAETTAVTGLSGAFTFLKVGIVSAIESSIALMTTPLGLVIGALAITVGIAGKAFYDYKQHQAEVEAQSKSLKDALNGVNEAIKNGDTKTASNQLDKLADSEKKYQDTLEKKKDIEKQIADLQNDMMNNPLKAEGDMQVLQSLNSDLIDVNKSLNDQETAMKKAGISAQDYANAQQAVVDAKAVDAIKEQTKAQLENRENLEGAKTEVDNYTSTIKSLYGEYQNLSAQENLSSEQKKHLGEVVAGLEGNVGNLNVKMDENGKTYISNLPLVQDMIGYLDNEGLSVDSLTQCRVQEAKTTSQCQVGDTQIVYGEVVKRINLYKAEIQAIQQAISAQAALDGKGTAWEKIDDNDSPALKSMKIQSQGADVNAEYRKYDAENPEFEKKRAELAELENAKKIADDAFKNVQLPSAPSIGDISSIGGSDASGSGKSGADKTAEQAEKLSNEIEKLKSNLDIDKFAEYNDAIKDVDNALTDNKTLREQYTENSPEYIKSEQQEIDLYKQKQQAVVALSMAQQQDADERKKKLQDLGFEFDANGKLIDSDKKLLEMQDQVNSMGGDTEEAKQAKQDAINQLKDLQTQVKDYGTLVETTIPQTINQYNDLANSIKKVNDQMNSSAISELEKYEELQKSTEEQDAQNKYDKESDKIDNLLDKLEELHNAKLQNIEDEETALENEYNTDQQDESLDEKKTALEKAQLDLEKAKNQLSVKTYQQNADGSWSFGYTANQSNVDSAQNSYDSANKDYNDTVKENEYNEKKQDLEDEKTAEEDSYNNSKQLLDDYKTYLSDSLEQQKEKIDTYYEDTNKLASDKLQELVKLYGNDWATIFATIQKKYDQAKTDNSNAKSSNTASADKVKKDKKAINKLLDSDNESEIDDSTIKNALDSMGSDLEDYDDSTEKEITTHNSTVETNQSNSYKNQLNNLKSFGTSYLTLTDKFLELLQVLYDFRFTNITTIAEASTELVTEGLVVAEEAYEKWREIQEAMGIDTNSIDISAVQKQMSDYEKNVSEWTSEKSSYYSADAFKQFADQVGNSLSDVLTSSLSSSIGNAISSSLNNSVSNTTNNSNSSNSTTVNINGVNVNANNAQDFLASILKIANNKADL